jgi:hypothetical protein
MAQNPALTQMLTALNAAPHPGMGNDFFAQSSAHHDLFQALKGRAPLAQAFVLPPSLPDQKGGGL